MALKVVRFVLNFGNESRLTSIPILTIDGKKRLSFSSLFDKIKQKYSDNNNAEYKISCELKQGYKIAILDEEDLYLAVESMQGFDGETCVLDLSVKADAVISCTNLTVVSESIIDISESTTPIENSHIQASSIALSHSDPSLINEPLPVSNTETASSSSSSNRNKRSRTESLSNHTSTSSSSVNETFYTLSSIYFFMYFYLFRVLLARLQVGDHRPL